METPQSGEKDMIAAGAVTALTLLVAFVLFAAGVSYFWVAFPVGFGGVLPLTIGIMRRYQETDTASTQISEDTPIATLRERYANGELTDEEFETQVEKLIKTESDVSSESKRERERAK